MKAFLVSWAALRSQLAAEPLQVRLVYESVNVPPNRHDVDSDSVRRSWRAATGLMRWTVTDKHCWSVGKELLRVD